MDRLVLIDGYSLMHRAFYAIPALSKDGVYTNALFGFFNMLLKVVSDAAPDYLIVTLDAHAPTFRHKQFADYKAGRKPMPEEIRPQVEMLRGLLKGSLQKMGQLFSHEESRSTNVATFLALLELIRAGRVKVDDRGSLQLDRTHRRRKDKTQ